MNLCCMTDFATPLLEWAIKVSRIRVIKVQFMVKYEYFFFNVFLTDFIFGYCGSKICDLLFT